MCTVVGFKPNINQPLLHEYYKNCLLFFQVSNSEEEDDGVPMRSLRSAELRKKQSMQGLNKGGKGGSKGFNPEKVIMAIEKFSVIVFFFSFLTFNIVYWLDIIYTLQANESL